MAESISFRFSLVLLVTILDGVQFSQIADCALLSQLSAFINVACPPWSSASI